jgi:hypothetical protein
VLALTGITCPHEPPETTGAELASEDELDSEEDPEEVGVSVVGAVSVGAVVCSVVVVWASGVAAACVEVVVCSVFVLWVSPAACVEVEEAASGACAGDLRAFAGLALCVAGVCPVCWLDREAFPPVPAPFAARVLPGKACAATSENTPVSITEPASSQRLQRVNRRRAASRE